MDQVWLEAGPLRLTGTLCVILIFATHFLEDEWRVWSVQKKGAPDNLFFYIWDQIIHYAVLYSLAPVIDGGTTSKFGFIFHPLLEGVVPYGQAASMGLWERLLTVTHPENWVLLAILFVIVTHFTTITIYFIEKDFFGGDFPEADEKYISMAERLIVTACFLLPGFWWTGLVAVWIGWVLVNKFRKTYDFSWVSIIVGNSTALVCGILARSLFYS